jgi:hypothetical protein
MKNYYDFIDALHDSLIGDALINQVTKGSLDKITNAKKDMYPLAHVMIDNGAFESNTVKFSVTLIVMDIVDYTKEDLTDLYYGNNNEDDIHNQTLMICQRAFEGMRRGAMNDLLFSIESDSASFEFFVDRFTDDVAGCTMTFDVVMPNEMTIC